MSTIKELMQWRFACKHFDTAKKIDEKDLLDLMDTVRLSPSSFGIQAWKFVIVTNQELKEKLIPACYDQPQIGESSALVFFCARTDLQGETGVVARYIEEYIKIAHLAHEQSEGFRGMVNEWIDGMTDDQKLSWVQRQLYIAMETVILAAAEKGIDSCPIEGFDPVTVAKTLELSDNLHPTVLVSLGFRKMDLPSKVRFPLEEVIDIRN